MAIDPNCKFCQIAAGKLSSQIVFEDAHSTAFLDNRPVFPGHVLLVPKDHIETLSDLPKESLAGFFEKVQHLAIAVEKGMNAEGTFVAINNRVSQSVPHLHVHVVPRKKKDGLRGFFWPRTTYKDDAHMREIAEAIRSALERSL